MSGYVKSTAIQRGTGGTAVTQAAVTYIGRTANSQTRYHLASTTQYRNDNGTGGQTAPIPFVTFARTSASPMTVSTPFATITGDGWINVAEIRLLGSPEPLAVT